MTSSLAASSPTDTEKGRRPAERASAAVPSTSETPKWRQAWLKPAREQTRGQDSEPSEKRLLQERLL